MPENPLPNQLHMQSLQIFRKYELDIALKYFPTIYERNSLRVLELGAGTGLQAKYLAELGYAVSAIDLQNSRYKSVRVFSITDYDGQKIPFNNEEFDVVFSSNVLEHVININDVMGEMYRVLKPGGRAVHIIPSPACRMWSIPAHYVWLVKRVFAKIASVKKSDKDKSIPRTPQSSKEWVNTFFPSRHGERGNTVTEIYYFSKIFWKNIFHHHGFETITIVGNGVFYTMANAVGALFSLRSRKIWSHIFGSSCFIYVLTKK